METSLRMTPWHLLWMSLVLTTASQTPSVDYLEPHEGGVYGETKITIYGRGFASDQFNFGDGRVHLGNTVVLKSLTQSYGCPVHEDGSLETQIMCHTPMNLKDGEPLYIEVSVDGVLLEAAQMCNNNPQGYNCRFTAKYDKTPTIDTVTPASGFPGTIMEMTGRLFTNLYAPTEEVASNGEEVMILRVYYQGQLCDLRDDSAENSDTPHGLELFDDGESDYGLMKCHITGTFVGNQNGSFLIDGPHGRSLPGKDTYYLSATNKILMFQSYTGISDISPGTGSTEGGTTLTITGLHFDNTTAPPVVKVGDKDCLVMSLEDEEIICETQKSLSADPKHLFTGSRGVNMFVWNNTASGTPISDVMSLTEPPDQQIQLDQFSWSDDDAGQVVTLTKAYFVPPSDNEFTFYLRECDSSSELYMSMDGNPDNKVKIAHCSSPNVNQPSERMSLEGNKPYYMELVHVNDEGPAKFDVSVKIHHTRYTETHLAAAVNEKQKISLNSEYEPEIQRLDFSNWPSSAVTSTSEEQEVTLLTDQLNVVKYRLGLHGAYTVRLNGLSSPADISSALNELPLWSPGESVTATVNMNSAGLIIHLIFSVVTGGVDLLEAIPDPANVVPVTFSSRRITRGTSDLMRFRLAHDGVPSPPIDQNAAAEQMDQALTDLFSVRCPHYLETMNRCAHQQTFEENKDLCSGTRIKTEMPFCGRWLVQDPTYIYRQTDEKSMFDVFIYNVLCFAFNSDSGTIQNKLYLNYYHRTTGPGAENVYISETYDQSRGVNFMNASSTGWGYTCIDMKSLIVGKHPDLRNANLKQVNIYAQLTDTQLLVDNIAIFGGSTSDIPDGAAEFSTLRPSEWIIEDVLVTGNAQSGYEITLPSIHCPPVINLFSFYNLQPTTDTGDVAVYRDTNWPVDSEMTVERIQATSGPVMGTFSISYGNWTSAALDVYLTADEMKAALETCPSMGSVSVTFDGICTAFSHDVTWLTEGGDRPLLDVNYDGLHGPPAAMVVEELVEGCVWMSPIRGDTLRHVYTEPQVELSINHVPSTCLGDCSFTVSDTVTSVITATNPATGSLMGDTVLIIEGAGFSEENEKNTVTIGGVECDVISSTSTEIQCRIGAGPPGSHRVQVHVHPWGYAKHDTQDFYFGYLLYVDNTYPSEGSLAGGTTLSVEGNGFGPGVEVLVGSLPCDIIQFNYTVIECHTPAVDSDSTVSVSVSVGSITSTSPDPFSYSTSYTAIITAVNTTEASVAGGTYVEISVTGLTLESGEVMVFIGEEEAVVASVGADTVTAILPGMSPGSHVLMLHMANWGCADVSSSGLTDILYTLDVSTICPNVGSLGGGSVLTITGSGFSEKLDLYDISVGGYKCEVNHASNSDVVCTIENTGDTHHVDNFGNHPELGTGYQWNPQALEIIEGDTVVWEWSASNINIGYKISETEGLGSTTPLVNGFGSVHDEISTGQYMYRFTETGDFYYMGGDVLGNDLFQMLGSVRVFPQENTQANLHLLLNGFNSTRSETDTVCPTPVQVDGCVKQGSSSSDEYDFEFNRCYTPVVTNITDAKTTLDEEIVIEGHGFSDVVSENNVAFGGWPCDVKSSSESQLTCTMDQNLHVDALIPLHLNLQVMNSGLASLNIHDPTQRAVKFSPSINSLSPSLGSLAGGTFLTINGRGFGDDMDRVFVTLTGSTCALQQVTHDQIICKTASATQELSLKVTVVVAALNYDPAGNGFIVQENAVCVGDCTYNYTQAATPQVDSVAPSVVTTNMVELQLNGKFQGEEVTVIVGDKPCLVTAATTTLVTCTVEDLHVGVNHVEAHVAGFGDAQSGVAVTVEAVLSDLMPTEGSLEGGTEIVISGLGFHEASTSVAIGSGECNITQLTATEIRCVSPAGESNADVIVTSNSIDYPITSFSYVTSHTPTVTAITPDSGIPGESVTITGTLFGTDSSKVAIKLGNSECAVTNSSPESITCTAGQHTAGTFEVGVHVDNLGTASSSATFTYQFEVNAISHTSGSVGGGQSVEVSGVGFSDHTKAYICGQECTTTQSGTSSSLTCNTPLAQDELLCDVDVYDEFASSSLATAYAYDPDLTATITGVSPARGGTAGNTKLTIVGTSFGNDQNVVTVAIDGADCTVDSVEDTQIICFTGEHKTTAKTPVTVTIGENGDALQGSATFEYVDVWSSEYSWGYNMPVEGSFVIIPTGQTILLDTVTPILKILHIQGGKLIFDDEQDSVELHAEYILIMDGGVLQVGTEEEPYQNQAMIMLHGHTQLKELPMYGVKMIAVREGLLDLHGKPVDVTWTRLAQTARVSDKTLHLQTAVPWSAGDYVAIASTGDHHSQNENEKRQIDTVSEDGLSITLTEGLEFEHLGVTIDVGLGLAPGSALEARAEVGLLAHNVVVRGSDNDEWHDEIEECPEGFDTGEFSTQTCFQGRHGEELGSDQFGSHIIVHSEDKDKDLAVAKIENIEVTYAGQAFRLGRYAIHFHLIGKTNQSYVKGCAIHRSFNRAVNIHGTDGVIVYNNVVFDIMGGAFFLEDGVEINNLFEQNLAIFVISSTSLQNDDITPAGFWITNPDNIVKNNAVAGGTHFGTWYRMHEHPDGPSFDENYCPRRVPLGEFRNNTVHSNGWFGLWIFQKYTPMVGGGCDSTEPETARFYGLTAWNCEKGAEWVDGGALQFREFFLVQNQVAGFDLKTISNAELWTENGAMLADSVIASKAVDSSALNEDPTHTGVLCPLSLGLTMRNLIFIGFDNGKDSAFGITHIDGTTGPFCGGFRYDVDKATFISSPNKIRYQWEHEGYFRDIDGSLTGSAGYSSVPTSDFLPAECTNNAGFSVHFPGSVCTDTVHFHRFGLNKATPSSLIGKDIAFTNTRGTSTVPFIHKDITHKDGWVALLPDNYDFSMDFVNAEHITNISYRGEMYDFSTSDNVIITLGSADQPDRVSVTPGPTTNASAEPLSYDSENGDWYYSNETGFSYIVTGNDLEPDTTENRPIELDVVQCYYEGCTMPDIELPNITRPDNYSLWSDPESWDFAEEGWGGHNKILPTEDQNVRIPTDVWMVLDMTPPPLSEIYVYGVLEVEPGLIGSLSATHIVVMGKLIVGAEGDPFTGDFSFILRGSHSTPQVMLPAGPAIGAKAIGIFGSIDMHGIPTSTSWTHLDSPSPAGSSVLSLDRAVDWSAGDKVVVTTTSFEPLETEIRTLLDVSDNRLTLDSPLTFYHEGAVETLKPETDVVLSAEVGLLSRNVRIIGEEYPDQSKEAFGARLLIGSIFINGIFKRGYGRISNVEFERTGQEGYVESYDPRFSVSFLDLGETSDLLPCYVRDSAFYDGFSPAIGIFGTNYMDITNNVIHNTVGSAVQIGGTSNRAEHNLVTKVLFPGSYNGRYEQFNFAYHAGIQANDATTPVLINNVVAGSQRAGFWVDGERCDTENTWHGNIAHSSAIGVMVFPEDGIPPCTQLSDFTVYRNFDFGIYVQIECSFKITGLIAVDNTLSVFPMVYKPSAVSHDYEDKYVELSQSTIAGRSSSFVCGTQPLHSDNWILSENGRSWNSPDGGMIGVSFPTFSGSDNTAPQKKLADITTYNTIRGHMHIKDVTFSHFGSSCGSNDYAITTNIMNEDAQHPIQISSSSLYDVLDNNKIWYHRADIKKINPADCVDMDCDAKKKALLHDIDGSFLEDGPGSIIPESEYEWDGDPARGIGDYRIPKTLLTDPWGNRIDVDDIAPYRGIVRNGDTCEWRDGYQAYKCPDYEYKALMVESMDSDTETRRVSPVAVLADGYLDLVNGPQDHGWCSGYTCQKRLSLFITLVALGHEHQIYMTGTTPQSQRLHMLNSDSDDNVVLAIFYERPWRLDVHVDGTYVMPNNGYIENNKLLLRDPSTGDYYPDMETDENGANFFDDLYKELWILVKGGVPVDISTSGMIILSFDLPGVTADEFYESENIARNLALYLDIDEDMIVVAEAVPEEHRKRRSDDVLTIIITIINQPANFSGGVDAINPNTIWNEEANILFEKIVTGFQVGELSVILEIVPLENLAVVPPPPPTNSGAWEAITTEGAEIPDNILVLTPQELTLLQQPIIEMELEEFMVEPQIRVVDSQGAYITLLGSDVYPWEITVSLRPTSTGDPSAQVTGETTVQFIQGWANFSSVMIDKIGTYILDFNVVYPAEATHFSISSNMVTVNPKLVDGRVVNQPTQITRGHTFHVIVDLVNDITRTKIQDIAWRGHTWTCTAELYLSRTDNAVLAGSPLTITMDSRTGEGTFSHLALSESGICFLKLHFTSEPREYNMSIFSSYIHVYDEDYVRPDVDENRSVQLKFLEQFYLVEGLEDLFYGAMYNSLLHGYSSVVVFSFGNVTEGSIIVTFEIRGTENSIVETLDSIWGTLQMGYSLPFEGHEYEASTTMFVDGEPYTSTVYDDGSRRVLIIVIGVLAGLLLLAILVVIAVCIKRKKDKKVDPVPENTMTEKDRNMMIHGYNMDHFLVNQQFMETPPPYEGKLTAPWSARRVIRVVPSPLPDKIDTVDDTC